MANVNRSLISDCARAIRAECDWVKFDGYRYCLAMPWVNSGLRYIQVAPGRNKSDNYIQNENDTRLLGVRESMVIYNLMKRAYNMGNRTVCGDAR